MNQVKYIHSASIARQIDYETIHTIGIPSLVLMEHAAMESVKIILSKLTETSRIVILCGPGNNGGDGLAIARLLHEKGYYPFVSIPKPEKMSNDERIQYDILCKLGIKCIESIEDIKREIQYADIIVDCLFGNGLSRDIKGNYEEIIHFVNDSHAYVYAIDVPSGLDATTGKILNISIQADETICLDCFKEGCFINDGNEICGQLHCVDIGIPSSMHSNYHSYFINEELIRSILPQRSNFSHKGTFKKALMIGGSQSMHGAITLAAKACYLSGIGTLTLMIPDCIGDILAKKMEFAMNLRVPSINGLMNSNAFKEEQVSGYGLISIGNGMGQNENTVKIVESVLKLNKPTIVDADGIWALKENRDLLKREAPTILTPHIKEMSYLVDKSIKEILKDPITTLREFTNQYPNTVVILKSSTSIIGAKDAIYILNEPNSALAKGGSGDILCGIVTGLAGQTNDYLQACVCASYIHSQTAKKDIDPACYQPNDCLEEIPNVFKKMRAN